jgi:hypothetical protein
VVPGWSEDRKPPVEEVALVEAVAAVWVEEWVCKPIEAQEKETNSEVKICQEEMEPVLHAVQRTEAVE